jgi:hypothetical protein
MKLCVGSFLLCLFMGMNTAASGSTVFTVHAGTVDYTITLSPDSVIVVPTPLSTAPLGFDIQVNLSPPSAFTDPAFGQNIINGNIFLSSIASFTGGVVTVLETAHGNSQLFQIGSGGSFRDFSSGFLNLPLGSWFLGIGSALEYDDIYTYGFCLDPFSCSSNDVIDTFQDVVRRDPVTQIGIPFSIVLETPIVTPLPAALPLFAGGAGVLGFLGWRRKRTALAA